MISVKIKEKRARLKLSQKELADAVGMGKFGDRTIRAWENGENIPRTDAKIEAILNFPENTPFKQSESEFYEFKFIDLFAGIGGIRLGFQKHKGLCVFSSEWNKFAQKTYEKNFGEVPKGDITKIYSVDIPDHDVLCAGFPCQPFSQAGLKKGFEDTRGTLFFEIQRIIANKKPKAFLLENVKQLKGHNRGKTLDTILRVLRGEYEINRDYIESLEISKDAKNALEVKLNYHVDFKVLRAYDFGLPQNRERIFIVGFDKDAFPKGFDFNKNFTFPEERKLKRNVGSILEDSRVIDPKYTISEKLWAGHLRRKEEHKIKGNGFGYSLFNENSPYTSTISARYYKDGSEVLIDQGALNKRPRKLTPTECKRLQGFPENFIIPVSDTQAYRQFGNSVAVPVIEDVAEKIIETLKKGKCV